MIKTTFVIMIQGHITHHDPDSGLTKHYDDYPSEADLKEVLEKFAPGTVFVSVEKRYRLSNIGD